jgi:hypothetical protein
MITDEQFHAAMDRLGRSDDGRTLYLFLQKRLMAVTTAETDGALQRSEGERTFAAKLISLMAIGIRESGGSNTSTDGTGSVSPDQPIVFAVPKPRSVSDAGRGARRRITADTHVPGYDGPAER